MRFTFFPFRSLIPSLFPIRFCKKREMLTKKINSLLDLGRSHCCSSYWSPPWFRQDQGVNLVFSFANLITKIWLRMDFSSPVHYLSHSVLLEERRREVLSREGNLNARTTCGSELRSERETSVSRFSIFVGLFDLTHNFKRFQHGDLPRRTPVWRSTSAGK